MKIPRLDIRDRSRRSILTVAAAAALALAPSLAFAQAAPGLRGIRITDDAGRLVAIGDLDDGRLDVEAVRDGSGFGTMVVYLDGGETVTLDATLDPTLGEIVVFGSEFDETLAEYVARYGLDVAVEWDDSVDDDDWNVDDAGPVGGDDDQDDDRDDDDQDDDQDGDDQDGDDQDDDDRDDDLDDDDRNDDLGDDQDDDDRDDDGVDGDRDDGGDDDSDDGVDGDDGGDDDSNDDSDDDDDGDDG